jgi:hypothetical protein
MADPGGRERGVHAEWGMVEQVGLCSALQFQAEQLDRWVVGLVSALLRQAYNHWVRRKMRRMTIPIR